MNGRYRGALYGLLIGDSFGALFRESSILSSSSRLVLRNFLDSSEQSTSHNVLKKPYTSITALAFASTQTLITRNLNGRNQVDGTAATPIVDYAVLATNFVEEFLNNMNRGFDPRMIEVFYQFKKTGFSDVFAAAQKITDSGDNGAAMYVTPIALFCDKHGLPVEDVIRDVVRVTHTHESSLNGAILHGQAIAMNLQASKHLDTDDYLDKLIETMSSSDSYRRQLENIRKLLKITDPSEENVVNLMGHSVDALYSIPSALYCFLRASRANAGQDERHFRRGIEYAITIGGHSNAIASFTGALCGAFYGEKSINPNMLLHCEGFDRMKTLADDF